MDLIDHYIQAVRVFLPKEQREDIIRELLDDLRSQAADTETELGRPLSDDEQASLLQQYGHPMLMAARYRPQRHLIGPVVFPYYWLALKITLGLVVGGHAIAGIVQLGGGATLSELGSVIRALVQNVLGVLGWFTVFAAVADRWLTRSKVLEKWNPSAALLPRMGHAAKAVQQAERSVQRHGPPFWSGRGIGFREPSSVSGFVVGVVVSVWWLLALRFPVLMFGPGAANLDWGPAMDRLYPVLAVAQVVSLSEHFVRLAWPHAIRFFRATRIVWTVTGVFFLYFVLTSDHQWVIWYGAGEARARLDIIVEIAGFKLSLMDLVNYAFSIPFIAVAIFCMLSTFKRVWRWLAPHGPSAAHA